MVSKYLLGEVVQNPEAEGRIAKWALELMGQNIMYAPRNTIKSQVLADFMAEWTEIQTPPASIEHETWTMYFDGSVMKEGARRRSLIQRISCGAVKDASSMLDKLISRRRRYRPSPSHGLSPSGTSTWRSHSDKRPGASPTFS
jgi:hypothetical protein